MTHAELINLHCNLGSLSLARPTLPADHQALVTPRPTHRFEGSGGGQKDVRL